MKVEWQVQLDHDGRVVVGPAEDGFEGRYLVVPQEDGSLALHALERRAAAAPAEAPTPPPEVHPEDPDAAEAELARWGARALGDLRPCEQVPSAVTASGSLPLIEVHPEDRPQPAAQPSDAPEANAPALSAVDAAWRYWLIQNRDAHDLFKTRGASSRRVAQPAPDSPSSKSPA